MEIAGGLPCVESRRQIAVKKNTEKVHIEPQCKRDNKMTRGVSNLPRASVSNGVAGMLLLIVSP